MFKFGIYPNLYQNEDLILKDLIWTCDCSAIHDRDLNTVNNIKSFALNKAGIAQINACGMHVRPKHSYCAEAYTVKQKALFCKQW